MKENSVVDSHIQVTQAILKRFQNKMDGKVYYLDLSSNDIDSASSRKLGTEAGYYSKEHETYMNREIEHPFSRLCSDVCNFFDGNKDEVLLRHNPDEICKRFLTGAIARSNLTMSSFQRFSYTASSFDDQSNHDAVTRFSIDKTNGGYKNGISPIIENYKMVAIHNCTKRQFVVPRNCFYIASTGGYQAFVMPISPLNAIELIPKEYERSIVDGQESHIVYIDSPDDIILLNEKALETEYAYNKCFVAAQDRSELEDLQSYLVNNRDDLEAFRAEINQ